MDNIATDDGGGYLMFMKPENHLIFMDVQVRYEEPTVRLPREDIEKMVEAGIKTALICHVDWNAIETFKGERDFSYYDERVQLLKECGMNVLIDCFTHIPKWMPDEWKVKGRAGNVINMVSPWNVEAMDYTVEFIKQMICRYESETSMAINSWLTDGETLFPNEVCIYDDAARGVFSEMYGRQPDDPLGEEERQFLLSSQVALMRQLTNMFKTNRYSDMWTALHPALGGYTGNGCEFIPQILDAIHSPCVHLNHIYFTWRQWTNYYPLMNEWKEHYQVNVFGGAEYCEGVVDSTRAAIEQNIRGLVIAPCHPFTGHLRIEDWMLDNIREACQIWQER